MGCGNSSLKEQVHPIKNGDNNNYKLRRQLTNKVKVENKMFVQKSEGKVEDSYIIQKQIGQGHFGVVKKAIHKITNEERAIKIIKKAHEKATQKSPFYEIEILRSLDHPHILKIFEFYEDKDQVYVVMELLKGGELFDRISEDTSSLSEEGAQKIVKQVLSAINYAHNQGIMHRDLKPENILLEVDSNDNFNIKVIDWGGAIRFEKEEIYEDFFGTRFYMSPEQHLHKYNFKCDLWSIGVILFVLISGESPFGDTANVQKNIIKMKYEFQRESWSHISDECVDLVKKLMCSQESRLTAQQALKHPWFSLKFVKQEMVKDKSQRYQQQPTVNQTKLASEKNDQSRGESKKNLTKLKQFQSTQKFQVAVLNFIAFKMISQQEYNYLRDEFKKLDLNGDGTLTKQEIQQAYKNFCSKQERNKINFEEMFAQIDIDNNGVINFTEFISATMEKENVKQREKLQAAFNYFDQDKNGYITQDELGHLIGGGSSSTDNKNSTPKIANCEEENIFTGLWQLVLDQSDQNKDGKIEFGEFENMMNLYANSSVQTG